MRRSLLLLPLLLCAACPRPGTLPSECRGATSRGEWTEAGPPGELTGRVIDLEQNVPVGNLQLRITDLARHERTSGNGAFRFTGVPEGRHVVVTEGSVYGARTDTIMMPVAQGLRGELHLETRRSPLRHCSLAQ